MTRRRRHRRHRDRRPDAIERDMQAPLVPVRKADDPWWQTAEAWRETWGVGMSSQDICTGCGDRPTCREAEAAILPSVAGKPMCVRCWCGGVGAASAPVVTKKKGRR